MMDDSIVEDVHRARGRILDACHGDLRKWIERLKAAELQHQDRLVGWEDVQGRASVVTVHGVGAAEGDRSLFSACASRGETSRSAEKMDQSPAL
jgi:hypothetical protein